MINKSFILLPCHSLEDFPVFHTGDDASSILASWTALWNPHLISLHGKTPPWHRVDEPPEDSSNAIVFIPTISVEQLPTGFADRLKEQESIAIRAMTCRDAINEKVLSAIGLDPTESRITHELCQDFFALGYVYLQVQLMARMLRYTSYLDDVQFENLLVKAAKCFVEQDDAGAQDQLSKCFDLLCEERNRFYPMDAYLMDLVLVAPTTAGKSFRHELEQGGKKNFLISGQTLNEIEQRNAESFELLASKTPEQINVVSGQYAELPTQLLSIENVYQQLQRGIDSLQELGAAFTQQPKIFARRRFGLGNRLPSLLDGFGFVGAIHATFDEGYFPEGSHPNINWEGVDGDSINAVGRTPISAESPDAFLNLGVTIGESLDSAHTASLVFAHWPNQCCPWYDDLRRASRYADVLGTFVTCGDYFSQIEDPGFGEEFTADQYSTPFLKQAVIRGKADPISKWIRYWQIDNDLNSANSAENLALCLGTTLDDQSTVAELRFRNAMTVDGNETSNKVEDVQTATQSSLDAMKTAVSQSGDQESLLVVNPHAFPRRVVVDCKAAGMAGPIAVEKPVYAYDKSAGLAVVDVPSCGFAELVAGSSRNKNRSQISLAEDEILRNEFFELKIDSRTGGIKSIHRYDQRGNLFSQQISMRCRSAKQSRDGGFVYAKMQAESIAVSQRNDVCAEIQSQGLLVLEPEDPGGDENVKRLAEFKQSIKVVRGSRVLECEVELNPIEMPKKDPWNSYYCLRFAWPMESAAIRRSVNGSPNTTPENRFEAPQYVEIDDAENCVTVLTNGLPYHRRVGYRHLDSILMTANESARRFRFGIGVNIKNPFQSAIEFATPQPVFKTTTSKTKSHSAFLFHFDNRCIVATNWEAIQSADGQVSGVRLRLLETQNRSGQVTITAPFEIQKAAQTDFTGKLVNDGKIADGNAVFDFVANAYFQVELIWRT